MAITFALNPMLKNLCLPESRQELLSEVLQKRLYGEVTHIWHHPGHLFVTTDEGRKLFTFDCKPASHDHVFDSGCLDIASIPSSVVDVSMTSESVALVVAASGQVQCWKFSGKFDWSHLGNFDLCLLPDSSIISVTYMNSSKKIVWCERQEKNLLNLSEDETSIYNYCIKSKQISTSLQKMNGFSTYQLVYNCPPCAVAAMTADLLFIQTQCTEDQVSVTIICTVDQQRMTVFLGKETFSIPKPNYDGIDFSSMLLSHIQTVLKCKTGTSNMGLRQCTYENNVAALSSSGFVEVFSLLKEQATKQSFQLHLDDPSSKIKHWFLCSRHIGIIQRKTLQLYSLQDGELRHKWKSGDLEGITCIAPSSSPSFLTWVLTGSGLFSIQRSEAETGLSYSSPEHLPHNHLLQTDVLHLAHLHQLTLESYDKDVSSKLQELKATWLNGKISHQVQIAEKIEPLIDEYMRLETVSKSLKASKEIALNTSGRHSVDRLIKQEIVSCKTASKVQCHAKLLWLSQAYPQQLLAHLTKGITLHSGKPDLNEISEWQALLDLDGHDLSKFEIVCRLLFVLHPEKLVHFVQCAESVNEHKIGVSAFMRRKHTLIFYKKACDCLPPAETSCNPPLAGAAYARLISSCKEPDSDEKALKYLLTQGLWSEAVSLLKATWGNKQNLPCYLFVTVSALANNQVLSEFLPEIFDIMPSWRSFLTFAKVTQERPEIRAQQSTLSVSDVFQQKDTDASIADIKLSFLKLVKDLNSKC